MARDQRFPAHRLMRRVNPATLLILAVGVVLMVALPGDALIELIIASTILPTLIVGGLIIVGALYFAVMMVRNRAVLDHEPGADEFAPREP